LLVSEYSRDQKRSKDSGHGTTVSNTRQRSPSPHVTHDVPGGSRQEPDWTSRDAKNPSRENPAMPRDREGYRQQHDRRDVTLPTRRDIPTSNNDRQRHASHSDSSAGLCLCLSLSLFACLTHWLSFSVGTIIHYSLSFLVCTSQLTPPP